MAHPFSGVFPDSEFYVNFGVDRQELIKTSEFYIRSHILPKVGMVMEDVRNWLLHFDPGPAIRYHMSKAGGIVFTKDQDVLLEGFTIEYYSEERYPFFFWCPHKKQKYPTHMTWRDETEGEEFKQMTVKGFNEWYSRHRVKYEHTISLAERACNKAAHMLTREFDHSYDEVKRWCEMFLQNLISSSKVDQNTFEPQLLQAVVYAYRHKVFEGRNRAGQFRPYNQPVLKGEIQ